jgi:hypothetical protein
MLVMNTAEFFKTLKDENLSQLERRAGVSRQALYNAIKSKNMKLANFSTLAKSLGLKIELTPILNEENLMQSLAFWGAPVAFSRADQFSFEITLAESLKQSRVDGFYESVVPYTLVVNRETLNPLKIAAAAFEADQVNVMGYYAEMAKTYKDHKNLRELLKFLRPAMSSKKEFLILSTKSHFPELFKNNKIAHKWNLMVRGSPQDHFDRWDKWQQLLK